MADEGIPSTAPKKGKGWIVVIAFLAVTAGLLGIGYFRIVPETWFRDFMEEVGARATIVPGPPSGSAFPTMRHRPEPDHPYICFANYPPVEWDRLYVVPPLVDVGTHPSFGELDWRDDRWSKYTDAQRIDDGQLLFVLSKDGVVVDVQAFFSVWGNALPLANDTGYSQQTAVFVAESRGVQFNLAPATDVPSGVCSP